jgi:hypothetical protein
VTNASSTRRVDITRRVSVSDAGAQVARGVVLIRAIGLSTISLPLTSQSRAFLNEPGTP